MQEHINLLQGDCLQTMKTLADNSVDAIVSDPPYGISFMAKKWDYDVPSVEVWKEAMRVLKPGGHALIACGTRTQHRMVVNIEDAGFEIRDVVSWIYGSGFPKSLNISKAIDKAAGAEREVVGAYDRRSRLDGCDRKSKSDSDGVVGSDLGINGKHKINITAPATDEAKQWDGWGTALKPSSEFFTLCRKPLSEKTIAKNVLKWGTGGINIDGCRVGNTGSTQGRFPANLIHDGSPEVLELFPETKPSKAGGKSGGDPGMWAGKKQADRGGHSDNGGSAARFFYCAKASKKDRNEGLEGFEEKESTKQFNKGMEGNLRSDGSTIKGPIKQSNNHPTVKPTTLMQYLCRLITPTGGVVLDPYMGSGSTGKAAIKEGFGFVGCELDPEYFEIAKTRIEHEAMPNQSTGPEHTQINLF